MVNNKENKMRDEYEYERDKRNVQICQAKEAAKLYIKGLPYKIPYNISQDRFRAMIKCWLNGNADFKWE